MNALTVSVDLLSLATFTDALRSTTLHWRLTYKEHCAFYML